MITNRHLSAAPITEAIIDIRVFPSDASPLEKLRQLRIEGYPKRKPRIEVSGKITSDPEVVAQITKQELGFVFSSPDHSYVLQARVDGFTLSRLKPYENWEPFSAEASQLWKQYRSVIGNCEVKRLAVRFVNRIDIPLPIDDLARYLHTRPQLSNGLQQRDLSGFMMQLQMPQEDIGAVLNFREAMVSPPPGIENVVSVVVDIDLYRDQKVPQDDDQIWAYFNTKLRARKNEVFFGSITADTEGLFHNQDEE
jgi:uncharacterized protein (TIGR04255 family)